MLALENPENKSLQFAWWNMSQRRNDARYVPTPEEYEEARIAHSTSISKLLSGKPKSELAKQHMRENHADFSGEKH